ncbi:MAG: hypothetical protein ACE5R6_17635 [Candidatus Heimdallarchaeota archaeon]
MDRRTTPHSLAVPLIHRTPGQHPGRKSLERLKPASSYPAPPKAHLNTLGPPVSNMTFVGRGDKNALSSAMACSLAWSSLPSPRNAGLAFLHPPWS